MTATSLVGQKFRLLTVIARSGAQSKPTLWECRCDCGNLVIVQRPNLIQGNTKSCGCLKRARPLDSLDRKWLLQNATVKPSTGCWEWARRRVPKGYGRIIRDGKDFYVHRIACAIAHGPLTEGMYALHKCDNPSCCNPDHIYPGTHDDNMRDMAARGRSRKQGGVLSNSAKLTEVQVREIRASKLGPKALAHMYGVGKTAINKIKGRRSYLNVA